MTSFAQTLNAVTADDNRDMRLDAALDLLDAPPHRRRNGIISLVAVVAVVCSGSLLYTLVVGGDQKPASVPVTRSVALAAPVAAAAGNASFELAGSADGLSSSPETKPQPVHEAVLIGTEH